MCLVVCWKYVVDGGAAAAFTYSRELMGDDVGRGSATTAGARLGFANRHGILAQLACARSVHKMSEDVLYLRRSPLRS